MDTIKLERCARSKLWMILVGFLGLAWSGLCVWWMVELGRVRDAEVNGLMIGFGVVLLMLLRWQWSKHKTWALTASGVECRRGWLGSQVESVPYSRIRRVKAEQTIVSRCLGYGWVEIDSLGDGDSEIVLTGIRDPWAVKAELERRMG